VIYPFTTGDTIYGLSVSGSVSLLSDTSLVRIIVSGQEGYLPDNLITLQVDSPQSTQIPPSSHKLKIFPNPANNYFIIQAEIIDQSGDAFITISDMNGKQLQKIILRTGFEHILIPTSQFSPGVYIIQLYNGGEKKDSLKISLV